MKKLTLLMAMAICFVLSASAINPYAYLVSAEQHGVLVDVTYELNAPATAVALQFIENDAVVAEVPLDGLAKGENVATAEMPSTLTKNATYGLALAVTTAAHDFVEWGDNTVTYTNRAHATVDSNPNSPFFGYIYMANRDATSSNRGVNIIRPDYSFVNTTPFLPYPTSSAGRPIVAPDGKVWFAEYGDGNSGIWIYDPADGLTANSATQFFQGERDGAGYISQSDGTSTPGIALYAAGANSKLYVAAEDYSGNYVNGLGVFNVGQLGGTIAETWNTAASLKIAVPSHDNGNYALVATSKGVWVCQNRSNGQNTSAARSLYFFAEDGTNTFISDDVTLISGSLGSGIAVNADNTKLYMPDGLSHLKVYNIAWSGNTPTLTVDATYDISCSAISQLTFDYAGNLVASVGNSYGNGATNYHLAVFSLPTAEPTTVVTPMAETATYAPIDALYEIGDNQAGGWNPNVGTEMTKISGNVFEYETYISGDTYMAFVTELNSSWDYVNARRYACGTPDQLLEDGSQETLVKNNQAVMVSTPGFYTIKVDFNRMTISAVSVPAKVEIMQGWDSWKPLKMTNDPGNLTCSATIALNAGDYTAESGFKLRINNGGTWMGKLQVINRGADIVASMDDANNNCGLLADLAGDYEFVYTYATGQLEVTFPDFVRAAANTNYQSLCTPFDATVVGATAYELVSADGTAVNVRSVDELVAGHSYLLKPDAIGDIAINYVADGAITLTPVNPDASTTGFFGELVNTWTYQYDDPEQANWRNFFVLLDDDMFHPGRAGGEVTITPTHAYLRIAGDEIVDPTSAPIRIIENATDINSIEAQEQAVKFIENGQMFIKKNGVVYDAMGRVIR